MLVRELSGTSRLAIVMRGGAEHDGWDVPAHLLAAVVDAVNANTHAVIQVQSRTRVRPPRPVPRPGTRPPQRTVRIADLPEARPYTPG